MKKTHVFLIGILLMAMLFSACRANAAPKSVLKIGWAGSPDTLNPAAALLSESYTIFELVYSSLFERYLDGTYGYDLADNMTVSSDNLKYTFHIRDGVVFHDGTPVTANDVVFSLNFYRSHEDFPYMNGYTTVFDTIEATDDHTVVLTLTDVVPSIEYQLVYLYILPEHIWKDYDNETAVEFENNELIGSGPFKLVDYAQGEFVHLAKNPDWYGTMPKVDEVLFQTFSNQDALVQAIKTGQVDMITEMPLTAVASLEQSPDVQVVMGAPLAPDVTDLLINQVSDANCPAEDGICSGNPALKDHSVRLALAHAIDKQELIDVVLLGMGSPGITLIPNSLVPWYNTSIVDFKYDVAQANQILDDAGYLDINGDGIRETPDGSGSLEFRLNWSNESTVNSRVAELLADQWDQIGVKLDLQVLDPDTLSSICCPAFDYDLILWGWGSDPDPSFLLSTMITSEIPTGMSETGYSNPTYDQLFNQQAITVDPNAREQIVWEMQQIVFDDIVYIIPFYMDAVQAYRTDTFMGWPVDADKIDLADVNSLLLVEPVH
jgi:peptide/nickel transport system substrate-binding protein